MRRLVLLIEETSLAQPHGYEEARSEHGCFDVFVSAVRGAPDLRYQIPAAKDV